MEHIDPVKSVRNQLTIVGLLKQASRRIARQFGISQSDIRKALASDVAK
jgi:hypothetical protein